MPDWDQRYAATHVQLFGAAPNEYVREVMARSDFMPRTALCLGDGDGRNGAWLAEQGLAVTAVDISRVATEQALKHDRILEVRVERVVADLADWRPEPGRSWDVIFMIYLQCDWPARRKAMEAALSAVPPGGWFVAEGFGRKRVVESGLGPKEADLLYDLDAFLKLLEGFVVIEGLEGQTLLKEGMKHRGDANIVRLLAQRAHFP